MDLTHPAVLPLNKPSVRIARVVNPFSITPELSSRLHASLEISHACIYVRFTPSALVPIGRLLGKI
jgi:hypothetical protein